MSGYISEYRRRKLDESIAEQSGADPYMARQQAIDDREAAEAARRKKLAEAMLKQGKNPNSITSSNNASLPSAFICNCCIRLDLIKI